MADNVYSSSSKSSSDEENERRDDNAQLSSGKRRKMIQNPKTINQLSKSRAALLEDAFGYKSKENPFGDEDLSKPFIWETKVMTQRKAGIEVLTTTDAYLQTTLEKVAEVEEVRRRRQQREKDEDEREAERALISREKAQERYHEQREREERFSQSIMVERIAYRLANGRETSADFLIKSYLMRYREALTLTNMKKSSLFEGYIKFDNPVFTPKSLQMVEDSIPSNLNKMSLEELQIVKEDLQSVAAYAEEYMNSELVGTKSRLAQETTSQSAKRDGGSGPTLWNPLDDVSVWPKDTKEGFVAYLKALMTLITYEVRDKTSGSNMELSADIRGEVAQFLGNQSQDELLELKPMVKEMISSGDGDINYWEGVYDLLPYYLARAVCDSIHNEALNITKKMKKKLATEQSIRQTHVAKEVEKQKEASVKEIYKKSLIDSDLGLIDMELPSVPFSKIPLNRMGDILSLEEFKTYIRDRQTVKLKLYRANKAADIEVRMKAISGKQVSSDLQSRKPKFQNNVKTGYDWNRYNQAHYDVDNPPPRRVQGYRFNIYYPDLIDKTLTPHWVLEPSDIEGTVVIRFTAGPPYEDIAFRLVNRDWDTKAHNGYRNVFDKGVMQLHFNLKRLRYRK